MYSSTKIPPTPEEFYETLKSIKENYLDKQNDLEECHIMMDLYILETLESLGYKKGTNLFRQTPKWFA